MFNAARQVLRRHGVIAALKYAGYRLLQRWTLVDITHFMIQDLDEVAAAEERADVDCRFLSVDDVLHFASDPSNDLDPSVAERLQHGYDLCFGGIKDGRLACYCWFALHSIEARNNSSTGRPESGIALSYPPEFVFRYKGFTHPKYRGQRLYSTIAAEAATALQRRGIRFVLSTAEWTNFGALKSSYRSGFVYSGWLSVVWVMGRRMVWRRTANPPSVLIDREAQVLDRQRLGSVETTSIHAEKSSQSPQLLHSER